MRRLKINRQNLKRLGLNGNDIKNGYTSDKFWKDLKTNASTVMKMPWSEEKKATMLAIFTLTEDGTKPIAMNKKNLNLITKLVRVLLEAPVRVADVRKEMKQNG